MEKIYALQDKILLKKAHACGGYVWTVVRLGADVKLQCDTCKRFVNLTREDIRRRIKNVEENKKD